MNGVIQAEGLSKSFRNLEVLDGLDLEVQQGSVFGLIGPNGAGKTTTFRILMNIIGPNSYSGSARRRRYTVYRLTRERSI